MVAKRVETLIGPCSPRRCTRRSATIQPMESPTQIATIALAVSGTSALIAIVSLGWTIYTAVHLNAARILVAIAHENILGAGPRREVVSATVAIAPPHSASMAPKQEHFRHGIPGGPLRDFPGDPSARR